MKYQTEKLDRSRVKFTFEVDAAEWQSEIEKAYAKTKFKYAVPGFRKGHATKKMIEKYYGEGVFFNDAFSDCFRRSFSEAITSEKDLFPVSEPQADLEPSDEGVKFTAVVDVRPEVKLGQYKGMTLKKAEYNVSDKDIEDEINRIKERSSRLVEADDRTAENGDVVNLDYSGSVNGEKFPGGTAENQQLTIGSHSFIPGFEEQLIGMKTGESKDLKVKFPDDYHADDLKGKDAVFAVTIRGIKVKELPEFNDDLVKEISKFDTKEAYVADLKARLTADNEQRARRENENAVLEAVEKNAETELPDSMVEEELEYMLKDFEYQIQTMYYGMKIDDYFKYTGSTPEDFKKQRRVQAEQAVRTRLALQEIIKVENIKAEEADTDEILKKVAENAGKTLEEYKPTVSPQQMEYVKSDALMQKTMKFLMENNTFAANASNGGKNPAKKAEAEKDTAKKPEKPVAKKAKAD